MCACMGQSIVINLFEKHQAILLLDFMLRLYLALQEAASLSSKVTAILQCHQQSVKAFVVLAHCLSMG